MRIGIDIDGCLTKYDETLIKCAEEYGLKLDHPSYVIHNAYNITPQESDAFWSKYFEEVEVNVAMRPNADTIIKAWHDAGDEIYIITGRSAIDIPIDKIDKYNIYDFTVKWLKEHNIIYDHFEMNSTYKWNYCLDNKIDIMIEDSPEMIIGLAKAGIPTIIMNCSYNKEMLVEGTKHVNSWDEINL